MSSRAPVPSVAVLLVAAAAAFVVLVRAAWPFTVDDAYIVLHYGRNLAAGHGPTFHAGGPQVEGVTSPAWLLLLTVPALLGVDGVWFAKLGGVLAALGTGLETARLAARLANGGAAAPSLVAAVAVLCLVALPMTAVHAVAGLETTLFTWSLMALLRVVVGQPGVPPRALAVGALSFAVGFVRPEGNLAAVLAVLVAVQRVPRGARRPWLWRIAAVYVLPGALYFAARWAWYGLPLPLPFYVKLHDPAAFGAEAGSGRRALVALLRHLGPLWLAATAAGVVATARRAAAPLAVALGLGAVAALGADIMGYEWRFWFPTVVASVPFTALGVAWLGRWLAAASVRIGIGGAGPAAVTALALALAAMCLWRAPAQLASWRAYAEGLARAHLPLGRELARLADMVPRPTLLIADAGAVPFTSGWRTIDSFGLNEPSIATTGRHDAAALLAAQPDVVVLISRRGDRFVAELPWEQALFDRAQERGYELAQRLSFAPTYCLWVLCAPASPLLAPLRAWRPAAAVEGPVADGPPATDGCARTAVGARYASGIVVEAVYLRRDLLVVDVRAERAPTATAKFFVHVHAGDAADGPIVAQHDFAPDLPFTELHAGATLRSWTRLAPPLPPGAVLRLGLFDERAADLAPWVDDQGRTTWELRLPAEGR